MLSIKGKSIKNSWDEVTVSEFYQIKDITENVNLNDLEKELKIICVLGDAKEDFINQLSLSEAKEFISSLSFMQTPMNGKVEDFYYVGDRQYKLTKEMKNLTAGQFIDLSHYTKDKNSMEDNIPTIISILLIPIKKTTKTGKIKLETYLETPLDITVNNIIDNMKITEANGISVFFYLLFNCFLECIQFYLELNQTNQLRSGLKMLKENGKDNKATMDLMKMLQISTGLQINGAG